MHSISYKKNLKNKRQLKNIKKNILEFHFKNNFLGQVSRKKKFFSTVSTYKTTPVLTIAKNNPGISVSCQHINFTENKIEKKNTH